MGGVSAMASIHRVMEKHGDAIQQQYMDQIPKKARDQVTGVILNSQCYSITVLWELKNGGTLEGPSIDIDTLAETYPDCNVGY